MTLGFMQIAGTRRWRSYVETTLSRAHRTRWHSSPTLGLSMQSRACTLTGNARAPRIAPTMQITSNRNINVPSIS